MTKIIVEVCQNHLGSRKLLGEMIEAAARNGADYVKMQSIYSEDLTRRERFEEGETDKNGKIVAMKRPYGAEFDRLSKLDLTLGDHRFFIEQCVKHGVVPMTTIFSTKRAAEITSLLWPERIVKVASYDCASYEFLKELIKHFDYFVVSTGATFDDEIKKSAELLKNSRKRFAFLHCVTSYPNTLQMANLNRMKWLRKLSPEVGWSDHTLVSKDGLAASKMAIYLGADFIERHFTVLPADKTKDGPVSITPELLKELSEFRYKPRKKQLDEIKREFSDWKAMLGRQKRDMTDIELLNRNYYRGRFGSRVGDEWINNWDGGKI